MRTGYARRNDQRQGVLRGLFRHVGSNQAEVNDRNFQLRPPAGRSERAPRVETMTVIQFISNHAGTIVFCSLSLFSLCMSALPVNRKDFDWYIFLRTVGMGISANAGRHVPENPTKP